MVAGTALNITLEWVAVHRLGLWTYRTWHPTLPPFGTGMFAVLQAVTLLPLVFWIVHRWQRAQQDRAGRVAERQGD